MFTCYYIKILLPTCSKSFYEKEDQSLSHRKTNIVENVELIDYKLTECLVLFSHWCFDSH